MRRIIVVGPTQMRAMNWWEKLRGNKRCQPDVELHFVNWTYDAGRFRGLLRDETFVLVHHECGDSELTRSFIASGYNVLVSVNEGGLAPFLMDL
jgi:hypothetical protein